MSNGDTSSKLHSTMKLHSFPTVIKAQGLWQGLNFSFKDFEEVYFSKLEHGNDYPVWSYKLFKLLKTVGLSQFLTGEVQRPVSGHNSQFQQWCIDQWELCDSAASLAVLNHVGDNIVPLLLKCSTSAEMWETLRNTFSTSMLSRSPEKPPDSVKIELKKNSCSKCLKVGHRVENCFRLKSKSEMTEIQKTWICRNCKQQGHFPFDCTSKSRKVFDNEGTETSEDWRLSGKKKSQTSNILDSKSAISTLRDQINGNKASSHGNIEAGGKSKDRNIAEEKNGVREDPVKICIQTDGTQTQHTSRNPLDKYETSPKEKREAFNDSDEKITPAKKSSISAATEFKPAAGIMAGTAGNSKTEVGQESIPENREPAISAESEISAKSEIQSESSLSLDREKNLFISKEKDLFEYYYTQLYLDSSEEEEESETESAISDDSQNENLLCTFMADRNRAAEDKTKTAKPWILSFESQRHLCCDKQILKPGSVQNCLKPETVKLDDEKPYKGVQHGIVGLTMETCRGRMRSIDLKTLFIPELQVNYISVPELAKWGIKGALSEKNGTYEFRLKGKLIGEACQVSGQWLLHHSYIPEWIEDDNTVQGKDLELKIAVLSKEEAEQAASSPATEAMANRNYPVASWRNSIGRAKPRVVSNSTSDRSIGVGPVKSNDRRTDKSRISAKSNGEENRKSTTVGSAAKWRNRISTRY